MIRFFFLTFTLLVIAFSADAQSFDWVRTGNATTSATGVIFDSNPIDNGMILAGTFYGNLDFDSTTLYSQGRDIFVAKMLPSGQTVWAKQYGGSSDEFVFDMKTDHQGNICMAGSLGYRYTIGTDTLVSAGQQDAMIIVLKPNGEPKWARRFGSINSDFATAIAPDAEGNLYVAGFFHDTITVGSHSVIAWNNGLMTMFLAKFDSKGNGVWVKRISASNYQSQYEGTALDVDHDGNLILVSDFHGNAEFDTAQIAAEGTADLIVAKFTPQGKIIWHQSVGGPASSVTGKSVRVDPDNSVYVCGSVTNSAQFDRKTLLTSRLGFTDLYVAKYKSDGHFDWVQHGIGRGIKSAEGIAVDADGNSYITGGYADTLQIANTILSSGGNQLLFAASFKPDGTLRWARQAGRGGSIYSKAVGVDKLGNTYLSGYFDDTVSVGGNHISVPAGSQDLFYAMISPKSTWILQQRTSAPAKSKEMTKCETQKSGSELRLEFTIDSLSAVRCSLDNMLGETARAFIEQDLQPGSYEIIADLSGLPHEEYYARLVIGNTKFTKKIDR